MARTAKPRALTTKTGGRKSPKLTTKARRDLVEVALRKSGWSEKIVADLMKKTGASRRTLYRERDRLAALLAEEESAGMAERRALFLLDLRRTREAAAAEGDYSPAARMLSMESQILGVDRVPLPTVAEPDGPLDTSLEAVLAETRRLRRRAEAGDSYTAAADLLEREHGIVKSIREREDAAAAAERKHLDEAALLELATGNLAALPEALKARLREALG